MEVWGGNQFVSTAVQMAGLDAWVYSMPADGEASAGGGDVHYVSSCAAGAITRMMVADVSGHGADAAETARRLRRLMQRHINHHEQRKFVRALNAEFDGLSRHGRFATAVSFTYDAPPNRLLVCNAGHPPPLVHRQRDGRWERLDPPEEQHGNFPLGIDDVEYQQFEAGVEVGDLVLCYTDALIEARRDDGAQLDEHGLLELLHQFDPRDTGRLIRDLVGAIGSRGWHVSDDLTILLFRPTGGRPFVPLRDRLLAPIRATCAAARACMSSR
jgi:serine phosphatase RsbU (regulator of sigma subunit)